MQRNKQTYIYLFRKGNFLSLKIHNLENKVIDKITQRDGYEQRKYLYRSLGASAAIMGLDMCLRDIDKIYGEQKRLQEEEERKKGIMERLTESLLIRLFVGGSIDHVGHAGGALFGIIFRAIYRQSENQ